MNIQFVAGQVTATVAARVVHFWTSQNALTEENARERVRQLVALARDDDDQILGVATLFLTTPAELNQPMYQFRTFVAAEQRQQGIARALLQRTFAAIEEQMTDYDNAEALGILLDIPGDLAAVLSQHYEWPKTGFSYIGRRDNGHHLRIRYFEGVKLKGPV